MQRALVLLVGVEEGLAAARRAKGIVGRSEQHPSNAAPRRSRVDEEQVHLAVLRMDRREADDPTALVSRDEH